MPEATLKKYSEKINAGLWWMYNKYCKKDFGMMQLLVAIEEMVDATKLAAMLDMDIKLLLAKEAGISASETDIEKAATRAEEDDESSIEPIKLSQDYVDKLTEDDPEEEAFILAGLQE
jgi:translation elongation factor EF-Tu-like GTPase